MSETFQTFVRGVYPDQDLRFLEKLRKRYDGLPRGTVFFHQKLELGQVQTYARAWNPYDPLYNSERYGKRSFWGSMLAYPFYTLHQPLYPRIPRTFGDKHYFGNSGGEVEYFQPIHPGDTISAIKEEQSFIDVTSEGRPELRVFDLSGACLQYNQHGDLVCKYHTTGKNAFMRYRTGMPQPVPSPFSVNAEWAAAAPPTHVTTPEEWALIQELWPAEEIRGGNTRYWEDVQVGDRIPPVCTGPISELDMFQLHGDDILRQPPLRQRMGEDVQMQDHYGMWQPTFYPCFAGHPDSGVRACFYSWTARNFAIRAVTNYMSDMGEIRRIRWRAQQLYPMLYDPDAGREILELLPETRGRICQRLGQVGDTCICRGAVVEKNLAGTERQVRLAVWVETLDHVILQALDVTICLPSRGQNRYPSQPDKEESA